MDVSNTSKLVGSATPRQIGDAITVYKVISTGRSQDEYGMGSVDISLHTPAHHVQYMHGLRVECLDISERRTKLPEGIEREASRRLSYKQAEYVTQLTVGALNKALNGYIPSDQEIDQMKGQKK